MDSPIDWCRYFADLEEDPVAHPPRLTVREFIQAREHIHGCDNCHNRVERVLARDPGPQFPYRGMN